MDKEEREKWFEELGLEPKKVKVSETPVKSGVAVVENEEVDEGRREAELEEYRKKAGF